MNNFKPFLGNFVLFSQKAMPDKMLFTKNMLIFFLIMTKGCHLFKTPFCYLIFNKINLSLCHAEQLGLYCQNCFFLSPRVCHSPLFLIDIFGKCFMNFSLLIEYLRCNCYSKIFCLRSPRGGQSKKYWNFKVLQSAACWYSKIVFQDTWFNGKGLS